MLDKLNNKDRLGEWLVFITTAVLVLYPITRFVVLEVRSTYLIVLFLLSITAIGFRFSRFKEIKLYPIEKLVLLSFLSMFMVTLVSALVLGGDGAEKSRVGVYFGFLLSIPIYFLYRMYMPSGRIVWLSVVFASFVIAARAWLEVNGYVDDLVWKSFGVGRANGTMHPIRFGDLALLIGFMSLAGSLYIKNARLWMKISGVLAFFLALYASLLSQSRGGWIAIPALLVIVLWPLFRNLTAKKKTVLVLTVFVGVILVVNVPGLKVFERFGQAVSDVEQYQQHGNSSTSIGGRFDMYETAYALFLQEPLFGVGVGNYKQHALNYYKLNEQRMWDEVVKWDNPHNEILLHMATRGLIGLLFLVLMFAVGMTAFISGIRRNDSDIMFYAVSGLMIMVAYMHFGMSIALFRHRDFLLFFVVYIVLFLAGMYKNKNYR